MNSPAATRTATLLVAAVAAAGVLLSVSNRLYDFDLWQHLVVGKAIWQLHQVPTSHLWTWPSYGMPDVLPSWLFRALIWPFWSAGGVPGLFVWRWVTTLLAFALLWKAARALGARGLSTFVVLVLCSLVYRRRSMVRPETLAAIFFAAEIWILEARRHGAKDRSPWIVPLLWLWANAHLSYVFGLLVVGIHALGDPRARTPRSTFPGGLTGVLIAALAVGFLNPFGWRALWQPFEYILSQRHEPLFKTIAELQPVFWRENWTNGLPLLVLGWPAVILWRARRRGWDAIEVVSCGVFTALGLMSQRFLGFYALIAAPYVARGLGEMLARPAPRLRLPAHAALAAVACMVVGLAEWTFKLEPLGIRYDMRFFPVAACDFIATHGIRGRAYNPFYWGGYMLFRFWPDRGRLPFIDIHATGTPRDRYLYLAAFLDPRAWRTLDAERHFDFALVDRPEGLRLLDTLDADSSWSLVFVDDAAALYVRRHGPLGGVVPRFGYRWLVAGTAGLEGLHERSRSDSIHCAEIAAELERAAAASPLNSDALSLLANIALLQGRHADVERLLARALAANPHARQAHWRLGIALQEQGRAHEAIREFLAQRRDGEVKGLALRLGRAYRSAGDLPRARAAYRRALDRDPGDGAARDSLRALEEDGVP